MKQHISIVCDNESCNFKGGQVSTDDLEKYVDTKCPLCQENLLTKEDYERTLKLLDDFKKMQKIEIDYEAIEKKTGLTKEELTQPITVTFGTHKEIKIKEIK